MVEQVTLIRSGLDASGYVRGAEAIERANERIGASAERTARIGRRVEDVGRAYDRLARSLDPAIRGQERLANAERILNAAVERGNATRQEADRLLALAQQRYLGLGAAAQRTATQIQQASQQTGLAAHQVTNLTYQLQDAAVQLAGGQNPLLVIMQQGPQATAAVGGLSNAWRLLAQQITPTRLAVAGLTAVTGLALGVMEAQERRVSQLRGQLRGYHDDWDRLARRIEADSRRQALSEPFFGAGDIRQVNVRLAQLLRQDQFGDMDMLREVVLDLSRSLETDLEGALRRVEQAIRKPADLVRELAEQRIRGFDEALRRNVELLEMEGRQAEATALVLERLRGTFSGARQEGTAFERALADVQKSLTGLWEAAKPGLTEMLNWFAAATRAATDFGRALAHQPGAGLSLSERLRGGAILRAIDPAAFEADRAARAGNVSVAVPRGEREAVANALFDGLVRAGLSPAAAAGIVANAHAESGFNPRAIGDSGASAGLFQWRGSRREAFRAFAGVDPAEANVETQIRFLLRELSGEGGDAGARRAGELLRRPGITPAEAGEIFSRYYERPAAGDFAARSRAAAAEAFARRFAGREVAPAAAGTVAPAVTGRPGGIGSDAAIAGARPAAERNEFLDRALRDARQAGVPFARAEEIERQISRFERARQEVAQGSDEYRILTQRIEQLRASQVGLENSTDRTVRALAQQREIAEMSEGPLREVAQAIQQAREAARGEGRELTAADEARIQAEVLGRLAAERRQAVEALDRQVEGERRVVMAWRESAQAAIEAEARERAREEVRQTTIRGTAEEAAAVETLTQRYIALARAQAERNLEPMLRQAQQQIELLRLQQSLMGADPLTAERALARRQEEIRLENMFPGLSRTARGQEAIAYADQAVVLRDEIRRTKEMQAVGREVGSAFFEAIRGGLLEGRSWNEIRVALGQRLTEIMSRELLEKPLQQMFEQFFSAAFRGMGGGGGGGWAAQLGTAVGGFLGFGGGGGGGASALAMDAMGGFIFHNGGWVGVNGQPFVAPAALWRNAPTYHSGGTAGMRPFVSDDEVLAKLRRNELVLNDNQQRAVGRALAGNRQVIVQMPVTIKADDPGAFRRTGTQGLADAARGVQRVIRRNF